MTLQTPKTLEKTYVVTDEVAIHFMGQDAPPVLSTPSLVDWMESTSRDNAGSLLNPGEDTVGVSVHVRHLAPTPLGMKVRVVSKVTKVEGRIYTFEIEAFDEIEKIGEATHERASVLVTKFASRVAAKKDKTAGTG